MKGRALSGARDAISRATVQLASPFAVAEMRVKRRLGLAAPSPEEVLAFWESREPGSRGGDDRYRWEVSHKRCRPGPHVPPEEEWSLFRPDLERDADKVELALSLPISIAENASFLAELGERDDETGTRARALLAEAEPIMRRDLAARIAASHPWVDTFALRCIVSHDRSLTRFGAIALAIATSYGFLAQKGFVEGWRHPFHEKPLVSATAHLATALVRLGVELGRLGALARHVRQAQHANGGWGDPHGSSKHRDVDVMTTLVCADLLAHIDPSYDPEPALRWMVSEQKPSGFFVAHGPECVWLTGEVLDLFAQAELPFAERFTFPHLPPINLDRKTGLPFYAYFDDLTRLFSELPGVASTTTELAFIDLAGFGAFNNRYGQDTGDLVLRAFAEHISGFRGALAIRDGGDEFLVVGAPTRTHLAKDLDAMRASWPARFAARFPDATVVAPRILVASTRASALRSCRETLGRRVAEVKQRAKTPPPEGVLEMVS